MVQLPFLIFADMKQAESQEDDVSIEGMRILLAEDNELNMEIAEFLLTNAGAEIIRASNGKEAVEAFEKSGGGEINVILMDIMMPVMDGLEATREIRTMNRSDASAVAIIAMTANAFAEDKSKALKMNLYTPLVSQLDYQAHESQSVLEKLYGNSLKKFVTSLYHGKKISSEEVQDLSEFLKNLEDREE